MVVCQDRQGVSPPLGAAMDPVSITGLAGSIVGIVDVAVRSISALRALQQRWKTADLTISLLIGQLTALRAALNQIEEWISTSLNAFQHYQLVMDLEASLESCQALLLFINGQLTGLDWNDSNALSFENRIKAVLIGNGMHSMVSYQCRMIVHCYIL